MHHIPKKYLPISKKILKTPENFTKYAFGKNSDFAIFRGDFQNQKSFHG
jgi:hypothetical protein